MSVLLLAAVLVVMLFGLVVFFGAPYLPTMKRQTEAALDLLDLKPGQTMLELGCGDGRVLKAAAARGWKCMGYELNPILVLVARVNTWRYHKTVKVVWGSYWSKKWPQADGIFVFLLDNYMTRLDKKVTQEISNPVKLVSFAFKIPQKKIVKARSGVYLYTYK